MTDEIEVARRAYKKLKNGWPVDELDLEEFGAIYLYHPEVLPDVDQGGSE